MKKYNGKPLAVLKEEIDKEYVKTREKYYDTKQLENKALVRESSAKAQTMLLQCDKNVKEIYSRFRGDPYPAFDNLPAMKVKSSTNNASQSKTPTKGKSPPKIDLNVQDYLSTTHRKKRSDKRLAISIPIQNEIPKYALWTPITRSSKTDDDPVLRHLYYFGEDSEDDDDVDYFDVYEDSIVGKNAYDPEGEQIAIKTIHYIFKQNNIPIELVEKYIAKLEDPKPSKAPATPSTSRITRSPATANTPNDNNDENIDVSFIEVTLKVLAKFLKGKDIKKMKKFEISLLLSHQTRSSGNIVSDVLTHSYSSLWCRRCYVYDCKLHGTDFRPSGNKKRPRPPISKNKPCGSHCYLHSKEDSQNSYMTDNWDDAEIALFEKAGYLMGIKNYCGVATIVVTKTCEQIFRRSQLLGEIDKDDDHIEIGSSSDDARKKGKKMAKMEIDAENHSEYHPCDHPGRPCDSACPCRQGNVPCEKYCHCELDCPRRFPGCNCTGAGKSCSNRTCVCFSNYRECDPDLCGCTASEPLTAQFMGKQSCKNVAIQRSLTKRTIVGKSTVAGWGLFVREQVKKNDYLGEYIGEVISQAEADRRGKIYDKRGTSFLFNLNKDFVVDATRKGNKFRFINHSNDPNAFCRVTLVNGEHRIGIYAMSDLEPGQELFFDYRYDGEALKFVPLERERPPSPSK
ncbi:26544_t:CDS:10 [Gigaspora margarita]|uniref:[histone H3]-lysine(27) N-trimethyltransferase n=1 Tax=Gigaspora margarita TaxID=4874 RepID=A0ABN7UBG8_GIGMA|nr:26544_t:CDS:10 [Gigaspora margarita]